MLDKDDSLRLDASQCLEHPWFAAYNEVPPTLSVGVLQCVGSPLLGLSGGILPGSSRVFQLDFLGISFRNGIRSLVLHAIPTFSAGEERTLQRREPRNASGRVLRTDARAEEGHLQLSERGYIKIAMISLLRIH